MWRKNSLRSENIRPKTGFNFAGPVVNAGFHGLGYLDRLRPGTFKAAIDLAEAYLPRITGREPAVWETEWKRKHSNPERNLFLSNRPQANPSEYDIPRGMAKNKTQKKLTKIEKMVKKGQQKAKQKGVHLNKSQAAQYMRAARVQKFVRLQKRQKNFNFSANNTHISRSNPTFVTSSPHDGKMRIRHMEYIGNVSTIGSSFNGVVYSINPGLSQTFPWLSSLAQSFDRYRFHKLRFIYRATSADALNNTNTALGVVVMTVQYDVYDTAFTSKVQMETNAGTHSGPPSANGMCNVACKRAELMYVRNISEASGDLRLADIGNLTLATSGQQAACQIGELWVEYDVELHQPRVPFGNESTLQYVKLSCQPTTSDTWNSLTTVVSSGLTATWTSANNMTLNGLLPGVVYYFVQYATAATSISTTTFMSMVSGGTLSNNICGNAGTNNTSHAFLNTTASAFNIASFIPNATSASVQIGTMTVSGTCFSDIYIYSGGSNIGKTRRVSPLDSIIERLNALERGKVDNDATDDSKEEQLILYDDDKNSSCSASAQFSPSTLAKLRSVISRT